MGEGMEDPSRDAPGARSWLLFGGLALGTAALDLGSKAWALAALSAPSSHAPPLCQVAAGSTHWALQRVPSRPVPVLRGFFELAYTENCAGAFGFLRGLGESARRPLFLLVGALAVAFVLRVYSRLEASQRCARLGLPLVLGGALGNLVDRLTRGYVVDFLHAHWRARLDYPTFNVADVALVLGVVLLVLDSVAESFRGRGEPEARAAA